MPPACKQGTRRCESIACRPRGHSSGSRRPCHRLVVFSLIPEQQPSRRDGRPTTTQTHARNTFQGPAHTQWPRRRWKTALIIISPLPVPLVGGRGESGCHDCRSIPAKHKMLGSTCLGRDAICKHLRIFASARAPSGQPQRALGEPTPAAEPFAGVGQERWAGAASQRLRIRGLRSIDRDAASACRAR